MSAQISLFQNRALKNLFKLIIQDHFETILITYKTYNLLTAMEIRTQPGT